MSRSPFFFVEKYNSKTEKYELQHPFVYNYDHTKLVPAELFPYNGDHDLFSIVEGNTYNSSIPDMKGIHPGLPKDVCEYIQKEFDECSETTTFNGTTNVFTPSARWFTYADMYIYCLENPEVIDYDAMDEALYKNESESVAPIMGVNPVERLKKRVDAFFEVIADWDLEDSYSLIRIVFWIL